MAVTLYRSASEIGIRLNVGGAVDRPIGNGRVLDIMLPTVLIEQKSSVLIEQFGCGD